MSRNLARAAAIVTVMAGCGSAPAAPSSEVSSAVSRIAGEYTRSRPNTGPLALTLTDGTLKLVDRGAGVTILQDFSATTDGALRIGAYQHPERGSFCGPEVPETASYTWRVAGGVLTLAASDDPCADRDASLSGAWTRR